MVGRGEEIRLTARALLERVLPLVKERPETPAAAGTLAEANALLALARNAVPESPLIGAMRPLEAGSTLAQLGTRLAALERAITFV
ncbi:MAG: hypothetical protein HY616_11180 [Candidatus Rokubacteria bacterium]|nr:hypothetical protein [Candidatus Rokubacteria bacterium]